MRHDRARIDAAHRPRSPFFRTAASEHPPHVIRLRGPWRWEVRGPSAEKTTVAGEPGHRSPAAEQRAKTFAAPDGLPQALAGTAIRRLRLSRRFHRPTGLGPKASVELVIERLSAVGQIRLNNALLGPLPADAARFRITDQLQMTNELQLDLEVGREADTAPEGLRVDVRLEIIGE